MKFIPLRKGMLQHSRTSSRQKEPTDLNALCDEYLRLSYHGLRAKDKSFNVTIKTDFEERIGKVNIIPQDVGRVILNILNKAFYAAAPSAKEGLSNPDKKQNPTVWVSTKKVDDRVFISVKDNGSGIPQKVVDKNVSTLLYYKASGAGNRHGIIIEL